MQRLLDQHTMYWVVCELWALWSATPSPHNTQWIRNCHNFTLCSHSSWLACVVVISSRELFSASRSSHCPRLFDQYLGLLAHTRANSFLTKSCWNSENTSWSRYRKNFLHQNNNPMDKVKGLSPNIDWLSSGRRLNAWKWFSGMCGFWSFTPQSIPTQPIPYHHHTQVEYQSESSGPPQSSLTWSSWRSKAFHSAQQMLWHPNNLRVPG